MREQQRVQAGGAVAEEKVPAAAAGAQSLVKRLEDAARVRVDLPMRYRCGSCRDQGHGLGSTMDRVGRGVKVGVRVL